MSKHQQQNIYVYANWEVFPNPTLIGTLFAAPSRGKEIFSFEYSDDWLTEHNNVAIDPGLQLFHGLHYTKPGQQNFGVFLDSSPDRWGRVLMDRREAQLAREQQREEKNLLESDYLLGVYDQHRMGALRFKTDMTGRFLDSNKALASPPWASLRELEHASLELEKAHAQQQPNYSKWLQMLIAPGGSLGGARPKASVMDDSENLWIAKFPSGNDDVNIGAWELVIHKLAQKAHITVSEAQARKFNSKHHTFLNKRFDRTNSGERLHFASAMTLLQRSDGDDASSGVSYLELANFIKQHGANPAEDLEQLWRRIIFFICVSNVADHLRNHGFILQPNGWVLSPAFDMNPVAKGAGLKLNISETDNSQDIDLAKNVVKYFRISSERSDAIICEVVSAVNDWRTVATTMDISTREQSAMSGAFRVADNK